MPKHFSRETILYVLAMKEACEGESSHCVPGHGLPSTPLCPKSAHRGVESSDHCACPMGARTMAAKRAKINGIWKRDKREEMGKKRDGEEKRREEKKSDLFF